MSENLTKHELYTLAMQQGQRRFYRETFKEFERRVINLNKRRDKKNEPWRKDAGS